MRFRKFILNEDGPMGAPPMGGDPMAGGMPGAGAPPGPAEPPVIPKHADVWDVLDHILNKKSLKHDKQLKQQKDAQNNSMASTPGSQPPPPGNPALMM